MRYSIVFDNSVHQVRHNHTTDLHHDSGSLQETTLNLRGYNSARSGVLSDAEPCAFHSESP